MTPCEKYEHEGVPIEIYLDDEPDSPRNWSNVGTMVCWHRGYDLGDRGLTDQEREALERGGNLEVLSRYLQITHGATVVIPLGLLDHSGLTMYAGGGSHWSDSAGWDSGTVGFIFDTPEGREECGTPLELIEDVLLEEIKTYNQYLRGDVYGYIVARDTPDAESCWGYYGFEYCKEEAQTIAEIIARDRAELRKLPWLPTFGNPIKSVA